jgi:integrase
VKIDEALGSFLRSKNGISEMVRSRLAKHLTDFAAAFTGKMVDEITVEDVQRYAAGLAALGSASRMWVRGYLIEAWKFCRSMGWTHGDPFSMWGREPIIRAKVPVFYSREERQAIFDHAREEMRPFIAFSFATGLRQGTVRLLIWKWITLDGVLQVPEGAVKNSTQLRIPLSKEVLALLGPRRRPGDLVFPDLPNRKFIWKNFRKATWKAGCGSGRSRDTRATFANGLMRAGAPLHAICRLGGWNSPQTLLKHYCTDVPDEEARKYLEEM